MIEVRNLSKTFALKGGGTLKAVRDVSLRVAKGETLGIVGESGCGKSTLARLLLHLISPSSGEVIINGEVLGKLSAKLLRAKRRDAQMIFQDPQASLDPRMKVAALIEEPLVIHRIGTAAERTQRVQELCALVGLPADAASRFPHEFSGGQRQRIAIARALALEPALIVADEPVSALDVSIQAQILNLLTELKKKFGLTYVFISHDLAVIRHISDKVAVMYLGQIVESGTADAVLGNPAHPYTQMLMAAVLEPGIKQPAMAVTGEPPNPESPPPGCGFHPRCPHAMDICRARAPVIKTIGAPEQQHTTQCWLYAGDESLPLR